MRTSAMGLSLASLMMLAVACGDGNTQRMAVAKSRRTGEDAELGRTGGSETSADATQLAPCPAGQLRYRIGAGSVIDWVAVKGEGIPVYGTQKVEGSLSVPAASSDLSEAALTLSFNPQKSSTSNPLRDSRIAKYVFGMDESLPFRFHSTGLRAAAEGSTPGTLPGAGETLQVAVTGTLEVGGNESDVTVPILLTGTEAGFTMLDSAEPYRLDLVDLGLGSRIDTLMALVKLPMEPELTLRFRLAWQPSCKPK